MPDRRYSEVLGTVAGVVLEVVVADEGRAGDANWDRVGGFCWGHGGARCWRMGGRWCSEVLGMYAGVVLGIDVAEAELGMLLGHVCFVAFLGRARVICWDMYKLRWVLGSCWRCCWDIVAGLVVEK